ncbi:polyamine aminopropyltransferase [Streptomyces sp. NPDC050560]|uniref:polyamine aminopropyltransferase n=1 Tax=Streptomyces sp. NPDC050560 TaxID=3365630 RepID=UPI00379C2CFB
MIEQRTASPYVVRSGCGAARLPVHPGTARVLVLAAVFVCAACGLVYELQLVALASYLMGDTVTQTSVVLSVMVFAMGAGSLAAKRLRWRAAGGFAAVESALGLVGGLSAMALYAAFAWTGWAGDRGSVWLLVFFSLVIGILIGAEVPLLMVLIQRVRRQDAGGAVADLFAADYVGALIGGLAFPFLLLPRLGQFTGSLLTGAVNALAGGILVLGLFRWDLGRRSRWLLITSNVAVLGVLAATACHVDDFERAARRALYGGDIRVAVTTEGREAILTGGAGTPPDLYLDGRLSLRGSEEPALHRALVAPALRGPDTRVLVLGGSDGLAAAEALRDPSVRRVDVLTSEADVVRLARTDAALSALNGHVYDDPRVRVSVGDAFQRLRRDRRDGAGTPYDVVVSDLPAPSLTGSTKYYSREFYGLVARVLAPGGRFVVRVEDGGAGGRAFWTAESTLRAAGLRTVPYRVGSRDGLLAGVSTPRLPPQAHTVARPSGPPPAPSTLVHPRYGG